MFVMPLKWKTPLQSAQQIKHFGAHCSQFSVSGRLQGDISVASEKNNIQPIYIILGIVEVKPVEHESAEDELDVAMLL